LAAARKVSGVPWASRRLISADQAEVASPPSVSPAAWV